MVVADRDTDRGEGVVAEIEAAGSRAVFTRLDATSRLDNAATAAFLCSDDAGYFTGEILHPSGGFFTG